MKLSKDTLIEGQIYKKGQEVRIKESLPSEYIKRGSIRDRDSRSSYSKNSYGLDPDDLIGWFANKYNIANGWAIFKASNTDKQEFGQDCFRSYSERTDSMNVIRVNLEKGTYAFIDNKAYEEGIVKFEKMSPYSRIIIEPTDTAFKEFDIL